MYIALIEKKRKKGARERERERFIASSSPIIPERGNRMFALPSIEYFTKVYYYIRRGILQW